MAVEEEARRIVAVELERWTALAVQVVADVLGGAKAEVLRQLAAEEAEVRARAKREAAAERARVAQAANATLTFSPYPSPLIPHPAPRIPHPSPLTPHPPRRRLRRQMPSEK